MRRLSVAPLVLNFATIISLVLCISEKDRHSRQLDAQPAEKDAQPADLGSSVAAAPLAGAGGNRRGA